MSLNELTETCLPDLARGRACVVVATVEAGEDLRRCLASVLAHTQSDVPVVTVASALDVRAGLRTLLEEHGNSGRSLWLLPAEVDLKSGEGSVPASADVPGAGADSLTAAVNRAVSLLWPADVALLSEPCVVTKDWLGRLRDAARADSNTASASALADVGTRLALSEGGPREDLSTLADSLAGHTMALRPRLNLIVGPCVYLRREGLELVGPLDPELELTWALEVDLAQRCLLVGLAHVAADDVLVGALAETRDAASAMPARLRERYPYLSQPAETAASSVLPRAMEAARRPRSQLWVTIDARALDATITGTQRHILELIRSLAATDAVRLRLLVSPDTSAAAVEVLRSLAHTELLPIESIDDATPRSTIFHRPQQVFETADLRLALRLGERTVLNQLDLIAYRNPGYHADGAAWRSNRRVTRQALAVAERVVVFSDHTRRELLSDELAVEQQIRIVPPGLDHPSPGTGRAPAGLTAQPAENPPRFLLCLGTDFRHKNRLFALRLLASLRERHGWDGRLVLAGTHIPHGSSFELERDFLAQHPRLAESVTELGAVDEQEKAWLMGHAAAVVYPSVYEGFGLVPFEAALLGAPCVFASRSSLADVLPDEMATIVPWDPDQSAARVFELLQDTAARAQHVNSLLDAARSLTWKNAAEAMLDVYREAAVDSVREAKALSRDEIDREHELRELIAAHDALVARLVEERTKLSGEREHAQHMYDELNAEVGFGLSLIGPHGALPGDVQRALLALSDRPGLSRPLYSGAARAFRAARAVGRRARRLRRSSQ
jgi:glycosyltransferase involved in cell wall biosynthesis